MATLSRPPTAARPAAVLWDMDGTLVDTEPYWFAAEQRLVVDKGNGYWPDDFAQDLIGFDLLDSAAVIQQRGEVDLEAAAIVDYLLADVANQLEAAVPWQPGALELLDDVAEAGIPSVLVTMSWRSFADAVLDHLPGRFAATIVGDEIPEGRGKPDPLPYELGAAAVDARPGECAAIEDSVTGARSAVAAGCHVIVVPNQHGRASFPDGVRRVSSLVDVTLDDLSPIGPENVESSSNGLD